MSAPFSLLMDESNDTTDMSCVILVRVLDPVIGEVRTRFLDMPVVNIGTANEKHGLYFEKLCLSCQTQLM